MAWELEVDESYDKAAEQIRLAGTNALPTLISMLKFKEPSNQRTNSGRAIFGFRALGPVAKPAIPELIALLANEDFAGNAVVALGEIGPDAVPPLTVALTNENPKVRMAAASSLGRLSKHAESVAPSLIRNLKDNDLDVVKSTMRALPGIVKDPAAVLPALIGYVEHTNVNVQLVAMAVICGYRTKAKAASPVVVRALQHTNALVRGQAKAVLPYIDLESARRIFETDEY